MNKLFARKFLFTGLFVLLASGAAFAADTPAADGPKAVEAALQQGNYPLAEQELRQAIVEHPQSAKAHYMLAQVLAHEGNIGDAQKEAGQAKTLDPKISFTNPARFERFQSELNQALAPSTGVRPRAASVPVTREAPYAATEQPVAEPRSRGSIWPWVIGAVIVFLLFGWFRRRQQAQFTNPPGYGQGYGAPGPQGSYGNGSYPPPGYPQGPQGGSGMGVGGSILGGLAGGVLGAAAVNAYENHERREEGERGDYQQGNNVAQNPQDQAYDQLRNDPIDTGNNDDSWDNSGGGGDSFDSGGGDDSWS